MRVPLNDKIICAVGATSQSKDMTIESNLTGLATALHFLLYLPHTLNK